MDLMGRIKKKVKGEEYISPLFILAKAELCW